MSDWLIETLAATTFLMLAVMLLREPVARKFGAGAAYALWLAPALRMILPPLPAEWLGERDQAMVTVINSVGSLSTSDAPKMALESAVDWPLLSLMIWLVGATAFFGWHVFSYTRFVGRARRAADWLYAEDRIEVAASSAVTSPVAFGIFSKAVMLPADFGVRYDAVEQRLALAHEVAHHHRHDLPANLAALAVLALHWFNPVAHLAFRAFRIDQEAACDAQILATTAPQDRLAYGTALYKSATAGTPLAACAMGAATTLKARLSRIVARGDAPASRMGLGLALVGIFGLVGLTASKGIVAAPPVQLPQRAPILVLNGGVIDLPTAEATKVSQRQVAPARRLTALRKAVPMAPLPLIGESLVGDVPTAPSMPVEPVVPIAPMLATGPQVPNAPAPPAVVVKASNISCVDGKNAQLFSSEVRTDGSVRQEIRIAICEAKAQRGELTAQSRERMKAALALARHEIEKDSVIDAALRQRILAALDRQIESAVAARQPMSSWSQANQLQ